MKTPHSLVVTMTLLLTGCHSFGPDELKGTHPLYNEAINSSLNEQYLQNLVRLRYREPTYFLDVATVAATLKLELSGGLNQTQIGNSSATDLLKFNTSGAYTTSPTISYVPLQGEDFVKSVLSPIPLEAVFALTGSGWNTLRVFGLCVERINGLENAPTASGPMPDLAPEHDQEFARLMQLVEGLRGAMLIIPRVDPATKEPQLEIRSSPEYADAIQEIKQLLGLDPDIELYRLSGDFLQHRGDTISIRTRSLMSIFSFLSQHVEAPPSHSSAGLVTVTRNKDGSPFDWSTTLGGGLFHIRQSEDRPDLAFLAIPYRGHWFYIADNDLESKSTFMLLTQLFRLQAGATKSTGPVLTIPVR
jgi:hypothetical protein